MLASHGHYNMLPQTGCPKALARYSLIFQRSEISIIWLKPSCQQVVIFPPCGKLKNVRFLKSCGQESRGNNGKKKFEDKQVIGLGTETEEFGLGYTESEVLEANPSGCIQKVISSL